MTAPLIRGYRLFVSGPCFFGNCDGCADVACGCLDCHDVADTTVDWTPDQEDASWRADDAQQERRADR